MYALYGTSSCCHGGLSDHVDDSKQIDKGPHLSADLDGFDICAFAPCEGKRLHQAVLTGV